MLEWEKAPVVDEPKAAAWEGAPVIGDMGENPTEAAQRAKSEFGLSVESGLPLSESKQLHNELLKPKDIPVDGLLKRFGKQLSNLSITSLVRGITSGPNSILGIPEEEVQKYELEALAGLKENNPNFTGYATQEGRMLIKSEAKKIASARRYTGFQVSQAQSIPEKAVDTVAGVIGFTAQLALLKKSAPSLPEPVAWDLVSQANGGGPGSGMAMSIALKGIGNVIPAKTVTSAAGRAAAGSVLFGTTTYLGGGDTTDILINMGIPFAFEGLGITGQKWSESKNKDAMIDALKQKAPALQDRPQAEIEEAIGRILPNEVLPPTPPVEGRTPEGATESLAKTEPVPETPAEAIPTPEPTDIVPVESKSLIKQIPDKIKSIFSSFTDAAGDVAVEAKGRIRKGIDAMKEHHKMAREAEITAVRLGNLENETIAPERHELFSDAVEMGENSKQWSELAPKEQELATWYRALLDIINKRAVDIGLVKEPLEFKGTQKHVFHWWMGREEDTPYASTYGKFGKSTPQAKQRTHATLEEGRATGLKPASNVGRMIGEQLKSVAYAGTARKMYKTFGEEGILKGWDTIVKEGSENEYVRTPDSVLRKGVTFLDPKRIFHTVGESDAAISKDVYPFWNAYRNNPKYGTWAKLNFAVRTYKLAMSLFHPMTLFRSSVELGYNPVKGLFKGETIVNNVANDPVSKLLFTNGLQIHGYDPMAVKPKSSLFRKITFNTLIFDHIQPNLKWYFAYNEMNSKLMEIPGFDWSDAAFSKPEVQQMARQITRQADHFFSGEDIKLAGLESSAWLNKYYFSPVARQFWTNFLISPTWQRMHILAAKDVGKSIVGETVSRKLGAKESIQYTKASSLRYFASVIAALGMADAINYYSHKKLDGEGKHMWENPDGYGFTPRLPFNSPTGQPMYTRVFKSETEVAEMINAARKGTTAKFVSKISPLPIAVIHQFFPTYPNQYEKGFTERIKQVEKDLGEPLGLSAGIRYAVQAGTKEATGKELLGKPSEDYEFMSQTLLPFLGAPVSVFSKGMGNKEAERLLDSKKDDEAVQIMIATGHNAKEIREKLKAHYKKENKE
jgi:hypothetical protein